MAGYMLQGKHNSFKASTFNLFVVGMLPFLFFTFIACTLLMKCNFPLKISGGITAFVTIYLFANIRTLTTKNHLRSS